jgi:hypothetical protein
VVSTTRERQRVSKVFIGFFVLCLENLVSVNYVGMEVFANGISH